MERKETIKADARDFLTWLKDWLHQETNNKVYTMQDTGLWVDYFTNIWKKTTIEIPLSISNAMGEYYRQSVVSVTGILSVIEKPEMTISTTALCTITFAAQEPIRFPAIPALEVFSFKCYRVGENRTQIQSCCSTSEPEFTQLFDVLWQETTAVFEVVGQTEIEEKQTEEIPTPSNKLSFPTPESLLDAAYKATNRGDLFNPDESKMWTQRALAEAVGVQAGAFIDNRNAHGWKSWGAFKIALVEYAKGQ